MEKISIDKAVKWTAPQPLTLVCTEKPDGSTNLAAVSFVSYLSFNPPVIGFAMGKSAYTGKQVSKTGKVIVTIPGDSLREIVMNCGSSSGSDTDKAEKFGIELKAVPGSAIQIPADTKVAFVAELNQTIEAGNHYLYICDIKQIYGDESKEALFAWNGYAKAAPAREK